MTGSVSGADRDVIATEKEVFSAANPAIEELEEASLRNIVRLAATSWKEDEVVSTGTGRRGPLIGGIARERLGIARNAPSARVSEEAIAIIC